MRLGINLGYWGADSQDNVALAQEADRLGYHSVWTAEAYGSDAVTTLTWVAAKTERIKVSTAIMQMTARVPTMTAMTAATIDLLTGGRMLLGIGASGPQVVEGWHGVSYAQPLARTREYVAITRAIFRRESPLTFEGRHYQIPYRGADATGLGKPLKSTLKAAPGIPIYLAAIGPKNVELAAEIADGWLPIFFAPERYDAVFKAPVEAGLARAGKTLDQFDIAPTVSVVINDNLDVCYNMLRPMLALYVGGMGARGRNFYYDLAVRYGFETAATEIQDLYLSGDKGAAMARVPAELIDAVALVGPRERVRERLSLWRNSPVTTLNMTVFDVETLRAMIELAT